MDRNPSVHIEALAVIGLIVIEHYYQGIDCDLMLLVKLQEAFDP